MTEQAPTRCRSWLFTPATRPDRFAKANEVGADVLIVDLEDAVAPHDKERGRATVIELLGRPRSEAASRAVRMNGIKTPSGLADLVALLNAPVGPDVLILPKTESAGQLHALDSQLTHAGKSTRLVGLIESAKGLSKAEEIATATPRLLGLMLGAADMAADLGAEASWEPMIGPRSRIVAACALGGIRAIDSPYFEVRDQDGLGQELRRSVSFGFSAKAAVHPSQVGPINDALTPTDREVEYARKVIEESKKGVGIMDGKMIDEAVARRARRILAAAGKTAPT